MSGLMDLMRQAQALKARVAEMQKELEAAEFTGSAGGGAVVVVVNGRHEVKSVVIRPEAADSGKVEKLQDLVRSAVNDALRQADKRIKKEVGKMTGGLGLPGLF